MMLPVSIVKGPIVNEMDKEEPSSSKVKKTAKKMAKKDKKPRTVKLINISPFPKVIPMPKILKDTGLLNLDILQKRNIKMLDISATPDAVLLDYEKWGDKCKIIKIKIFVLKS